MCCLGDSNTPNGIVLGDVIFQNHKQFLAKLWYEMNKISSSFALHNSCTFNSSVSIKMFQGLFVFVFFFFFSFSLVEGKLYAKRITSEFSLSSFPGRHSSDLELKNYRFVSYILLQLSEKTQRNPTSIPKYPAGLAFP